MERGNITRTWGIALVIILAVVGLVVAFLLVSAPSRAQAAMPAGPSISVQWRAQSILESKFTARVLEDNKLIKDAFEKGQRPEQAFKGTYLQKFRLWNDAAREWITGEDAYKALAGILQDPRTMSITSISIVIDYQPYAGAASAETDVDAAATVRITFSASPDDNIAEGELLHRRVCPII